MTTDPIANLANAIRYTHTRYGASDAALEFRRRRGPDKVIEPTENDWELYRAAIAAVNAASQSDFIYVDAEIEEPEARRKPGDYIETEDEYRRRVHTLIRIHGTPDDLGRAIPMRDMFTLLQIEGDDQ